MIDGTSERVHHTAVILKKSHLDRCLRSIWGALTTKIHAVANEHGLPVCLVITPGQQHEVTVASELLDDMQVGEMLLADKA